MEHTPVQSNNHPSRLTLDTFCNGGLEQSSLHNVEQHLQRCSDCRMYTESVNDITQNVTERFPDFEALHHTYTATTDTSGKRSGIFHYIVRFFTDLKPVVVAAVLLAAIIPLSIIMMMDNRNDIQTKGGGDEWFMYVSKARYSSSDSLITCSAGDTVQLVLLSKFPKYIQVMYQDDKKEIDRYCCERNIRLEPGKNGKAVEVPFSIVLDNTWHFQKVHCISSERPLIDSKALKKALAVNNFTTIDGAGEISVSTFTLQREDNR